MLRLYKPIVDDIFDLHSILKTLVCDVWCEANDDDCNLKKSDDLKNIAHYNVSTGISFDNEIDRIYNIFKTLSEEEKEKVKEAWDVNNDIEKLCDNKISPIPLDALPEVVRKDIKPLFKWCYEELLGKAKVKGSKLEYYQNLIKENKFFVCPCCGLIDFEDEESICREAYDHYLPKALYPMASVNFRNLVPLCNKCNTDRKKANDPINEGRKAFYPFYEGEHNIKIMVDISNYKDLDDLNVDDVNIDLIGDIEKINTWNDLFAIKFRYGSYIKNKSKGILREMKRRHRIYKSLDPNSTYLNTIDNEIKLCDDDIYDDKKFLKKSFLEYVKNREDILGVY